ncbi:MAG: hypothetical protein WCE64_13435, partial [Bacteroidales bacterium]
IINIIENKENAKYSTKNNITEVREFFLATKNHRRTRTISMSILRLIATIRCMTRLSGSLFCPRWKMKRVRVVIAKKQSVKISISVK